MNGQDDGELCRPDEAHHQVEAHLGRARSTAVREAIRLAWEMQQR